MSKRITCSSCNTTLALPDNVSPNAKIKCPKCGQKLSIPTKKQLVLSEEESPAPVERRPLIPQPPTENKILSALIPGCSIVFALAAIALACLPGLLIPALIMASLATLVGLIGLLLVILGVTKGVAINLSSATISAAAILVAINAMLIHSAVHKNEELLVKNEHAASQAKIALDEADKKLAEAADAPRKAEEILKQAEEAPKKADAVYKMAKEAQEKANSTEKRIVDLLAKTEELETKNELDRKLIGDERAKIAVSQKALSAEQRLFDKGQKEIEQKKQELLDLKKEIESDKKKAEEDLETMKKVIQTERKKAEDKQKEADDTLKKIENVLKGATLSLKNKSPAVRLTAVKGLASLSAMPEIKTIAGEALVQAMMDSVPTVRTSANEAVEKLCPDIYPHIMTLMIGKDKRVAWRALEKLGNEASTGLPVLLASYWNTTEFDRPDCLKSLAKIAPDDERVVQLVLLVISTGPPKGDVKTAKRLNTMYYRKQAIPLVNSVGGDKKEKVKALLSALNEKELAPQAIAAIENIGAPEAAAALPALNALKLSPDDATRKAAAKAVATISGL